MHEAPLYGFRCHLPWSFLEIIGIGETQSPQTTKINEQHDTLEANELNNEVKGLRGIVEVIIVWKPIVWESTV